MKLANGVLLALFARTADSALRGLSSESGIASTNNEHRSLQGDYVIKGACTVANFASEVGGNTELASYLGTASTDDESLQSILNEKCAQALEPSLDLSDTTGKGPQFLKNFLDGGTTWNDNYEKDGYYKLSEDAAAIYDVDAKSVVFAMPDGGTSNYYPRYFSNFYRGDLVCPLGVIECCYTGSRDVNMPFVGNSEMCALDMAKAAKSNHIQDKSMTVYYANSPDQAYCTGFAYDKGSFDDSVKYNTLFHLAMTSNLLGKGLVKNIPGAPLCGCVEQMPVVDNAACVKAVEGYSIDQSGEIKVNISWEDCGTDLVAYYRTLDGRGKMEESFVEAKIVGSGKCTYAAESFLNDHMLVPSTSSA